MATNSAIEHLKSEFNINVSDNPGPTMVFAHGFGCDQKMWRFVLPQFRSDFRVVAFDYLGCGNSNFSAFEPEKYASLESYADDVVNIIEATYREPVIFVGHSVSSMIGTLAAVQRSDLFEKVIMIGPSPCYKNLPGYEGGFDEADIHGLLDLMNLNYLGWAKAFAPVVIPIDVSEARSEELMESFCSTNPVTADVFGKATFLSDYRHILPNLATPSLILQCSKDVIAPESVGEYVAANVQNGVYKKLEATGHCPHLTHPQETIQVIQDYLRAA